MKTLAAIILTLSTLPAMAETGAAYSLHEQIFGPERPVVVKRHVHRPARVVERKPRYVPDAAVMPHNPERHRCPYPKIEVVGEENHSEEQAQLTAHAAWQQMVRFRHGERAMSVGNAIDRSMSCVQSVPDKTGFFRKAGQKLVEGLTAGEKSTLKMRCEFVARPCNAPVATEAGE